MLDLDLETPRAIRSSSPMPVSANPWRTSQPADATKAWPARSLWGAGCWLVTSPIKLRCLQSHIWTNTPTEERIAVWPVRRPQTLPARCGSRLRTGTADLRLFERTSRLQDRRARLGCRRGWGRLLRARTSNRRSSRSSRSCASLMMRASSSIGPPFGSSLHKGPRQQPLLAL